VRVVAFLPGWGTGQCKTKRRCASISRAPSEQRNKLLKLRILKTGGRGRR
jgi:hypothetical protein